ncbi:MAG: hypothetical protein H6705_08670 [Myxococcales bacterium]|nr:hypothetical protein [Myxococcales bacterium]
MKRARPSISFGPARQVAQVALDRHHARMRNLPGHREAPACDGQLDSESPVGERRDSQPRLADARPEAEVQDLDERRLPESVSRVLVVV